MGAHYDDDGASNAGAVYIILGSSTPSGDLSTEIKYTGEASSDYAGYSVAGVGDINADGRNDFLIGAPYNDDAASNAGAAYLLLGQPTHPSGQRVLPGPIREGNYILGVATSNEYFGTYVGSAGDFDDSGKDDILIGASGNDEGGSGAGKIWIIISPMTFPRGVSVR